MAKNEEPKLNKKEMDLREELSDVAFNGDPGLLGSLAANMEPEYFDGLVDFILKREAALAHQLKSGIDDLYNPEITDLERNDRDGNGEYVVYLNQVNAHIDAVMGEGGGDHGTDT